MSRAQRNLAPKRYYFDQLDCADCAAKIELAIRKVKGLEHVQVNFAAKSIDLPPAFFTLAQKAIAKVDSHATLLTTRGEAVGNRFITWRLAAIGLSVVLLMIGLVVVQNKVFGLVALSCAYLVVGTPVIWQAAKNIVAGRALDEYSLMTIATFGAIAIGELPEAIAVMAFYSVGEYLQERAVDSSRRSVTKLLSLRPDFASMLVNGELKKVAPEEVSVGDEVVIKPGERLPLDGLIVRGESFLDTSPLTGEAVPRRVQAGDEVLAGTINQGGLLTLKVTKEYADSTVAKILEMVENAAMRKAPTERFISTFARYYTPVVVALAALLAVLPPLLLPGQSFDLWLYRALVLLVISCPCALVVSVPLSYFGGIGAASRHGILFKGANYLDALSKVHTVIFDKTGTLTKGTYRVLEVKPQPGFSREKVLELASSLETHSNHPVARAICAEMQLPVSLALTDITEQPGRGMSGNLHGHLLLVGNRKWLQEHEVGSTEGATLSGTVVYVALNGRFIGEIVVADELRADARQAVEELRHLGARHISMLTGDYTAPAVHVAESLKLDDYQAELLPQQKVLSLEAKKEALRPSREKLIFVGDGMNDAPVIARADVGIAMGGLGSDAAIEAADIVIMQDAPSKVPLAVKLSRYTTAIVRQNVAMSLGVKLLFLVLGIFDQTTIWGAVFADVGVTLLAIGNAMRAIRYSGG